MRDSSDKTLQILIELGVIREADAVAVLDLLNQAGQLGSDDAASEIQPQVVAGIGAGVTSQENLPIRAVPAAPETQTKSGPPHAPAEAVAAPPCERKEGLDEAGAIPKAQGAGRVEPAAGGQSSGGLIPDAEPLIERGPGSQSAGTLVRPQFVADTFAEAQSESTLPEASEPAPDRKSHPDKSAAREPSAAGAMPDRAMAELIAFRTAQLGDQHLKALALLEQYSHVVDANTRELTEALRHSQRIQLSQQQEIEVLKQQIHAVLENHR